MLPFNLQLAQRQMQARSLTTEDSQANYTVTALTGGGEGGTEPVYAIHAYTEISNTEEGAVSVPDTGQYAFTETSRTDSNKYTR